MPSRNELYTTAGYVETLLLRNKGLQHSARYHEEDDGLTWDRIQNRLGVKVERLVVVDTGLVNGVYAKGMHVTALRPDHDMECLWHMDVGTLLMCEGRQFSEANLSPMHEFEIPRPKDQNRSYLYIHQSHFDDLQKFGWKLWRDRHDRAAYQMGMLMDRMVTWRDRSLSRSEDETAELARKFAIERAGTRAPLTIAA
jgi:hypothetical protein